MSNTDSEEQQWLSENYVCFKIAQFNNKKRLEVNFLGVKIGFMNLGTYIVEVLTKEVIVMTKHNCSVLIAM